MSVYHADSAQQVQEALNSIYHGQTVKPAQILVVEDGPIDHTVDIVLTGFFSSLPQAVEGDRVRLTQNSGLAVALNAGLVTVSGDLIARMDADDISLPVRFEKQLAFFEENPSVDVLGCAIREVYSQKATSFTSDPLRMFAASHDEIVARLPFSTAVPHPGVMMRRRIVDEGYRYNETLRSSQDIDLWFRLIKGGFKFANLEEELLIFRFSSDVIKRRNKEFAKRELLIYLNGVYNLWGISWRLLIPLVRYIFRSLPVRVQEFLYKRVWRKR